MMIFPPHLDEIEEALLTRAGCLGFLFGAFLFAVLIYELWKRS